VGYHVSVEAGHATQERVRTAIDLFDEQFGVGRRVCDAEETLLPHCIVSRSEEQPAFENHNHLEWSGRTVHVQVADHLIGKEWNLQMETEPRVPQIGRRFSCACES
jgi:hypothetical protein